VKPLDVFQVDPKISEELISKYKAKWLFYLDDDF
jgi:hypothetical protein